MILLLDNFATAAECKELVHLYHQHKHLSRYWLGSYPINTKKISHMLIDQILQRSEKVVQKYFDPMLVVEHGEIKKTGVGADHVLHYDSAVDPLTGYKIGLASVMYLNDIASGHTFFKDGLEVTPRTGRIIMYDGKKYPHGVSKCLADRYSFPIWYKK